jgi:hypothetical protein
LITSLREVHTTLQKIRATLQEQNDSILDSTVAVCSLYETAETGRFTSFSLKAVSRRVPPISTSAEHWPNAATRW